MPATSTDTAGSTATAASMAASTAQVVREPIVLDSSDALDRKESKEERKAANSLATSDFSFTTPDGRAIAIEIARRQAAEDAFIKQHSNDAYLASVHQTATQFNTLCTQLSAYGDQTRALAMMEVGKRLSETGKRIAKCLDGIEQGIVDGMKKSSVSAQEALNNPGAYCIGYLDALRELAECSLDVTIFASKVLLRAAGNPELLQQQIATWLKETGSTLASAAANTTLEGAVATSTSLVTQVILNSATPAMLLGSPSNFVLFTSSLKGFLDTFKATRQALNARKFLPERAKTLANPSEMVMTEGAKILETAEREGIPTTHRALNTVENNKSMISECGSFGNAVKWKAAEEQAENTVWKSIKATDCMWQATRIPRSFELSVGNQKLWVHPNATEHMFDYVMKARPISHNMPINSQSLLASFKASVEKATAQGIVYTKDPITIGSWELLFSPPRQEGLLPVIRHALYKP